MASLDFSKLRRVLGESPASVGADPTAIWQAQAAASSGAPVSAPSVSPGAALSSSDPTAIWQAQAAAVGTPAKSENDGSNPFGDAARGAWKFGLQPVLKTLTVPASTAYVAGGKALNKAPWAARLLPPGMQLPLMLRPKDTGDVSWKNALGDWYTDPSGRTGLQNATTIASGIPQSNTWGQLGFQVLADPLWFVGIGTAPSKVSSAVKAARASRLTRAVDKVRTIVGVGKGSSGTGHIMQVAKKAALAPDVLPSATAIRKVALARALTSTVADTKALQKAALAKGLTAGSPQIKAVQKIALSKALLGRNAGKAPAVKDLRPALLAITRHAKTNAPTKAVAAALGDVEKAVVKVPAGDLKLVMQKIQNPAAKTPAPKTAAAADVQIAVEKLGETVAQHAPQALPALKSPGADLIKAFSYSSPGLRDVGRFPHGKIPELPAGYVQKVDLSGVDKFARDVDGLPKNYAAGIKAVGARNLEHVASPRDIVIQLGGKNGILIPTGLKYRQNMLGQSRILGVATRPLKPGLLHLKPLEKAAHAVRRSGEDMKQLVEDRSLVFADNLGLTVKDKHGVTRMADTPGYAIGFTMSARRVLGDDGDKIVRTILAHDENVPWEDTWSQMINHLDSRYQLHRAQEYASADDALKYEQLTKAYKKAVESGDRSKIMKATKELDRFEAYTTGRYAPQAERISQRFEARYAVKLERDQGMRGDKGGLHRRDPDIEAMRERSTGYFDNPFSRVTYEQFMDDGIAAGFSEETMNHLYNALNEEMMLRTGKGFAQKLSEDARLPEWNALKLWMGRERDAITLQIDREIDQLVEMAVTDYGLPWDKVAYPDDKYVPDIVRHLKYGMNPRQPGSLSDNLAGRAVEQHIMPAYKRMLTVLIARHFTGNAVGDFIQSVLTGNWRHATIGIGASVPGRKGWRVATRGSRRVEDAQGVGIKLGNTDLLKHEWNVGDNTMTGDEIDFLARMVGLGRGYHASDIIDTSGKTFSDGSRFTRMIERLNPSYDPGAGGFQKLSQAAVHLNMDRDNAQRFNTFMNHMRGGDDPITAGMKTVRVHYDYSELTIFEKIVMRNAFMFYTWMKKNMLLQPQMMAERPALYNMMLNATERGREHYQNEPEWYRKQGAVPTPVGNFSIPGNPMVDIYKWEASYDNLRQTFLGPLNPLARVPIELSTDKQMFGGGTVSNDEIRKPSLLADIMHKLNVPEFDTPLGGYGPVINRSTAETQAGISPRWAYVLQQTLGPYYSTPSANATAGGDNWDLIGRLLGIRFQENDPEKFDRMAGAKKSEELRKLRKQMRLHQGW